MMKRVLMVLAVAVAPGVATAQVAVRFTVPEVRVNVAPPPLQVEVQSARPSPDHTWIEGHWARRDNANVWISGVWTRPPHQGMVWEKDRWDHRNNAYYVSEGHWRWSDPATPTTVYEPPVEEEAPVEYAPPRDIRERRPGSPFRGAVWIPGYWGWNGSHHDWVAGRWSARQARAVWTPDRWKRQPGHGSEKARWVHVPGRWDHH